VTERLLRLLLDAAGGAPPPADGVVEVWAAPTGPVDAVLAFTAHHVVAAAVDPDLVAARLPDGDLSAPMGPAFLGWLGGWAAGREAWTWSWPRAAWAGPRRWS
jgi:hypothetical protein